MRPPIKHPVLAANNTPGPRRHRRLLRAQPRCRAAEIGIRVVSTILEPAEGKR